MTDFPGAPADRAAVIVATLERELEALELDPWLALGFVAHLAAGRIRALPEAARGVAMRGFPQAIADAMAGRDDAARLRAFLVMLTPQGEA